MNERDRLEVASAVARARFAGLMHHLDPEQEENYWGEIAIGYEPYYAYEEVLATALLCAVTCGFSVCRLPTAPPISASG